jgi:membrane-anchored protein YejM (alkaline phosphatase superfamily)
VASGGGFGKNSTRQRVSAHAMSNLQALSSLLAAAFLTIPAASSAAASSPTTSAHPNIVVIYADDLVMETDAVVGQVLAALDESGAAANTLVVFTRTSRPHTPNWLPNSPLSWSRSSARAAALPAPRRKTTSL